MSLGLKKFPAVFFRTGAGSEPVREWLKSLPPDERRVLGRDIATADLALGRRRKKEIAG